MSKFSLLDKKGGFNVIMNSKHFTQYWLNIFLSKTKFGNYGHMLGSFVIDKMWLQCKRSNKIQELLFVTNFHVPIIVSFNHWTTHQPRQPNQCQPGSTWSLRSRLCTSLHFYNTLHWNQGCRRIGNFSPNNLESGWKGGGILYLLWQILY